MKAMVLRKARQPLEFLEVPTPVPSEKQVLVKVLACAVCRTDLHVVDGELPHPKPFLIPGHEIVGEVTEVGSEVATLRAGDRVGIPGWYGPAGSASIASPVTRTPCWCLEVLLPG